VFRCKLGAKGYDFLQETGVDTDTLLALPIQFAALGVSAMHARFKMYGFSPAQIRNSISSFKR